MLRYREIVWGTARSFWKQFLVLGTVLAVTLPVVLRLLIHPPEGTSLADWGTMAWRYLNHPPLFLLVPMLAVLGIGLMLAHRMKIEIRDGILHLPSESRYQHRRIPLAEIVFCEAKPYDHSLLSQMGPSSRAAGIEHQVVPLPGYQGDGLVVGFFRTNKNVGNLKSLIVDKKPELEKTLIRVHVPSRNASHLADLINERRGRDPV
jgi:hypothetical protein